MFPIIENFINDYYGLRETLMANSEISYVSFIETHLKKSFLFSCASFYEAKISGFIKSLLEQHSDDDRVRCFASNKGISRQYHTYFQWADKKGNPSKNINSFLGMFGTEYKSKVIDELSKNEEATEGMLAFLIIGNERNIMAHENFLDYNLTKTFEEVVDLNQKALIFLSFIEKSFK